MRFPFFIFVVLTLIVGLFSPSASAEEGNSRFNFSWGNSYDSPLPMKSTNDIRPMGTLALSANYGEVGHAGVMLGLPDSNFLKPVVRLFSSIGQLPNKKGRLGYMATLFGQLNRSGEGGTIGGNIAPSVAVSDWFYFSLGIGYRLSFSGSVYTHGVTLEPAFTVRLPF